jgi:putative salt-induced outer membrane protein YdiY
MSRRGIFAFIACLTAVTAGAGPLFAQAAPAAAPAPAEPPLPHWSDSAELGWVATSGNSESNSFSFKNVLQRKGEKDLFDLRFGGLKVDTTTITLTATGTPPNVERVEDKDSATTAEAYYLTGRYDRKITEKFFWFGGAGWDRNEFAGIQNRYTAFGGVGNIWVDTDRRKWKTDYAITANKQDNVVDDPTFDDTFMGVRLSSAFLQKFGAHDIGVYTNDTVVDLNVDESEDWRVNMINAVALNISDHLALKVSLQWLYDNLPSLKEVDLFDPADPGNTTDTALVELDELDSIFTTALVIKY